MYLAGSSPAFSPNNVSILTVPVNGTAPQMMGQRLMLKGGFQAEWQRLNPRHVTYNSGFSGWLSGIFKESVVGYFAPLRMLYWLAKCTGNWISRLLK